MTDQFLPIKIKYSHWGRDSPIEVYVEDPGRARLYMFGKYVKFKAYIKIREQMRPFAMSLPLKVVEKAFKPIPVEAKNSHMLRLVLVKHELGKLEIREYEIIDRGDGKHGRTDKA